jgi:hypothetical protein
MIGIVDTSLQLQPIITAHDQWLSNIRSIPYWTMSVFSSTVTDLGLICESVTSSASVVRWLALHSWTLNFWILLQLNHWTPLRMTTRSRSYFTTGGLPSATHECPLSFITREQPKRSHHLEQFVCYYLFHPLLRNVCQSRGNALISTSVFVATKRAFSEPLSSNWLFRHSMLHKQHKF